ncbi:hypothetical protein [Rhizobium sp. BG4]|uniref:hypothetical protein n=1 Tax=Rhizobium sp. BG4 TaxID=2613770 RepID=UPI00193D5E15|nr:hypothetical protein [Rhizobium sp. BG4]QRM47729.1 hypothetical protein F2982_31375 [Rhizobium sp. BG4]
MRDYLTDRYSIRREHDGSWTIFDLFTGLAAEYYGRTTTLMDEGGSKSLCIVMNALDKQRRRQTST